MITFLNSNFFVGIATILTGAVAGLVYYLSQRTQKIQAARILLTEIRTTEEKIEQTKDKIATKATTDFPTILPTNSWRIYAPIFISNFDQDELKLLNSFYENAELIEEFAKRNNDFFWITTEERARVTVQKISEFAKEALELNNDTNLETYVATKRESFGKLLDSQNVPYLPSKTIDEITSRLTKIPSVMTSSCGIKLKRLAEPWYKFF